MKTQRFHDFEKSHLEQAHQASKEYFNLTVTKPGSSAYSLLASFSFLPPLWLVGTSVLAVGNRVVLFVCHFFSGVVHVQELPAHWRLNQHLGEFLVLLAPHHRLVHQEPGVAPPDCPLTQSH